MEKDEVIIGIDVGGTKIAAGIVNNKGEIIQQERIPTDLSEEDAVLYQLEKIVKLLLEQKSDSLTVSGIGIGLPGKVDYKNGIAEAASNIPYKSLPIGPELSSKFKIPVYLENDADAATLGEKWFGAGKGHDRFIYFTVGTGIGAGIIAGGDLVRGCEIGHTIVDPEGPICKCGTRGCFEAVAAGPAIARKMNEDVEGQSFSTEEVITAAENGNKKGQAIIEETAHFLALGLINVSQILMPEIIILGGGVIMGSRETLLDPIKDKIDNLTNYNTYLSSSLIISQLKQSGVIGTAAICLQKKKN